MRFVCDHQSSVTRTLRGVRREPHVRSWLVGICYCRADYDPCAGAQGAASCYAIYRPVMRKARRLASEFQGHMDDLVREADLDDVKQSINSIKNKDVSALINEAVDPAGEIKKELDGTMADAKREMNAIKTTAGVSPAASVAPPSTIETDDKPAGEPEKAEDATAKATPASQPAAQGVPSPAANSAPSKV